VLKGISRNVLILGLVSLFTDISSEMIYPLLPLFLTTLLHAGPSFIGVIEGAAETTASLLKLASGILSDRLEQRKPLVLAGYTLSSCARPLIALAGTPAAALIIRLADRVGKGVRTAPRDALISDSTPVESRGKAFGFHRAMDHAGALTGPLIASAILLTVTSNLRLVFWLAAIPGAIAVLLIVVAVRETPRLHSTDGKFLSCAPTGRIRRFLLIILLFTLGNSSDAFLLLRATQLGVPMAVIPLLWSFFHLSKMLSSTPFGALSDRIGRQRIVLAGWLVYALSYAGFACASEQWHAWGLFAFYGLFYGMTEGVEKAMLADLAPAAERGAAFGWYNCAIGIGALPASAIFGCVWQYGSPAAAFLMGAFIAAVSAVLFMLMFGKRDMARV
jgi:MFS family permease